MLVDFKGCDDSLLVSPRNVGGAVALLSGIWLLAGLSPVRGDFCV